MVNEIEILRAALGRLHSRILYEQVGIEFVGYSEALFKRSHRVKKNRTLADHLVWILKRGGALQAVQIRAGLFTGPKTRLRDLPERCTRLDPGDLARVHECDEAAARVLRDLLGLDK